MWVHKSVSRIQVSRKLTRKHFLADGAAVPPEIDEREIFQAAGFNEAALKCREIEEI